MHYIVLRVEDPNCPGGWDGDLHVKGEGMLVVSFRGVNYRFWDHLECSGWNANSFNHQGMI